MVTVMAIGDSKEEPADGGAADGGGDKGGDATSPDPDSFGEGGTDNNVVSGFNGKSFLEKMAAILHISLMKMQKLDHTMKNSMNLQTG